MTWLPYRCLGCDKRTATYAQMRAHHQRCLRFLAHDMGFVPSKESLGRSERFPSTVIRLVPAEARAAWREWRRP